jgi:hypothetical protein
VSFVGKLVCKLHWDKHIKCSGIALVILLNNIHFNCFIMISNFFCEFLIIMCEIIALKTLVEKRVHDSENAWNGFETVHSETEKFKLKKAPKDE